MKKVMKRIKQMKKIKNNTIEQEHWLNKVIDVVYNLLISVIIVFFCFNCTNFTSRKFF